MHGLIPTLDPPAEAPLAVRTQERGVHRDRAGILVELHHEQAVNFAGLAGLRARRDLDLCLAVHRGRDIAERSRRASSALLFHINHGTQRSSNH